MKLHKLIENHWYQINNLYLSIFLLPLSFFFFLGSKIRFYLYKFNLLKSFKLPVPVVIVGNISVGGVGKTPLTKHLAQELTNLGITVGVILRGYKSKTILPRVVYASDDSQLVGDEALIYAANGIRTAIGRNRHHAGLALLKQYPEVQLIIADDGMQHYRLQRDFEISVIEANRMLGNGFALPMGPLRETARRLSSVDFIVINGVPNSTQLAKLPKYKLLAIQTLVLDKIYNPCTKSVINPNCLKDKQVIAMAAIGNPKRFFKFLTDLGIKLSNTLIFPDHYNYLATDIPTTYDSILVTEKDYVKLAKFNNDKIWVVMVKTQLNNPVLLQQLCQLVSK